MLGVAFKARAAARGAVWPGSVQHKAPKRTGSESGGNRKGRDYEVAAQNTLGLCTALLTQMNQETEEGGRGGEEYKEAVKSKREGDGSKIFPNNLSLTQCGETLHTVRVFCLLELDVSTTETPALD